MTSSINPMDDQSADDSLPLRELHRLAGGRCRDCGLVFSARDAVGSIALGFKDAPRCLRCLARGLGQDPGKLRSDLVAHARRHECFARAWAAAEGLALADDNRTRAADSYLTSSAVPTPDEAWDAGGLGCGELVLELRTRLNALAAGSVLGVIASDLASPEDLPAWCRMTGNPLVYMNHPAYYIRRKEG